jgi:uncharacterized protein (TIGR02996 family)
MVGDTGSALRAAVQAAPADDAPWLVYADWLQENGRDAEAAAIRVHLPAVRAAVVAGHDLAGVLVAATRHPPGSPAWEAVYGPRSDVPVSVSPPPRPRTPTRESWSDGHRGERGSLSPLALVPLVYLFLLGFRSLVSSTHLDRAAITPPGPVQLPAAWVREPAVPVPPAAVAWDRAEVAGHTFREAGGGKWLAFRADGTATAGAAPSAAGTQASWWVDASGALELTAWPGGQPSRLHKLRADGDRYEVVRDGRPEAYVRQRP